MRVISAIVVSTLLFLSALGSPSLLAASQATPNRVLDISVQSIEGRIAAAITFSMPVKGDINLDQWLNIEEQSGAGLTGSWILDDKGETLYFTNIEPEHSYNISVKKGLPLVDWQLLDSGKSTTITVDAITPMLGFAGNGNLLADTLADGLPVISVNAGDVDVDFYRIPEKLLVAFLTDNTRRGQQNFWQIESYIKNLELVYTARFDLKLHKNQTATSYLPIKDIAPLQQQGVYVAIMRKIGEYRYSYPSTWFASSDLGIHLRIYPDKTDVNVNSLATAEPKSKVRLRLLDASGKELDEQFTDAKGAASFDQYKLDKASLLLATQGGHTAIVRLFGPTLDLSEFPVSGIDNKAQRLFFFAERDLYRPGELMRISALLRDSDGQLMPAQVITFKLQQPDGKIASEQRLTANALGYYISEWQLPKDAATSQWSIIASIPGQADTRYDVQVEEFLPERMELELVTEQYLKADQDFNVQVNGSYLYGAPAAENTLQSDLITSIAAHPFENFAEYHFANPQQAAFNNRRQNDDIKLNSEGEYKFTFATKVRKAATPLQIKLFASLLDSGGRPVSRTASSYVLPSEKLVGIRPLFADDTAPYDSNATFEVILSEGQEKLAAQGLKITLIRERRDYHWRYTSSEGWKSDYTESHYSVFNSVIDLKAGQGQQLSLPVDWGHYRLEVFNPATKLVTGYKFRAGWSADETVMAGRPDRIGLALNQQRYKVGDVVSVEIKAPAAGRGYLLVESDKALHRQLIDIPAEGGKVTFTVQQEWSEHNLYVSVLLIQPGQSRAEKLPRRMMGVIPLRLDREARKLQVEINSAADIRPNTELTVPIKVSVKQGEEGSPAAKLPSKVQVTLAAVDVGVLNISKFSTPDPFSGFFQQRAYSVIARDSYADLIAADKGVLATIKFGGDGDVEQNGATDPDVQIVSLFSGVVEVDAQGNAQVKLSIPDFNGRLRLMAVAFSAQSFGSAEKDLQVADPIVAQLNKPRFLRAGDKSLFSIDLNNVSNSAQSIELNLVLATGLHLVAENSENSQQKTLSIQLAKGQKKVLYFPVQASAEFKTVAIDLSLSNVLVAPSAEPVTLKRHWQLTIKPAWSISNLQWQTALGKGEKLSLSAKEFSQLVSKGVKGQLNVASQPPLDIASHLRALKAYPYGCLEQTTSGVFPQLYSNDQLLLKLGIKGSDAQARNRAINLAIQRLQSMQRGSGGFGLWSNQSPEEHWLTVYVLDFLLRAQKSGYQVPADNLKKAMQRVAIYLRSPNKISSYHGEVNSETKFAVRAYAAQVLSRYNQAPLSTMRNLYDRRNSNATPMALLQLGLALQKAGDHKRADSAIREAVADVDDFAEGHIYYSSKVRDLALSGFWLLEAKADISLWRPLLLALIDELKGRQWLSTQERNALFLIGRELQAQQGSNMQLAWEVDSQQLDQQLHRLQLVLGSDDLQHSVSLQNKGDMPVYVNLRVSGYQKTAPEPISNRIQVQRNYYDIEGRPFTDTQIRSGEKLIVELLVTAQEHLRHAIIVDLLPAGLEIENQNLADSYDQSNLKVMGTSISELMYGLPVEYQEYRDDRFVMALDLPRTRVKIYYLVRAVSAGDYQIPPTFAEDMYRPEIRHQGESSGMLKVLPR